MALEEERLILARSDPVLYLFFKYVDVYEVGYDESASFAASSIVDNRLLIFLREDFFDLPKDQRVIILAHELWHLILRHPIRAMRIIDQITADVDVKVRTETKFVLHRLYNFAADIKINDYYLKKYRLPEGFGISLQQFPMLQEIDIESISTEELFEKLLQNSCNGSLQLHCGSSQKDSDEKEGDDSQKGKEKPGDLMDPEEAKKKAATASQLQQGKDLENGEDVEERIKKTFVKVAMTAKTAGQDISAVAERLLLQLAKPKIKWSAVLRRLLRNFASGKSILQSYTRINRRVQEFPGSRRLSLGKIWALVDVSGSIGQAEFDQFISELLAISNLVEEIKVVFWDTKITSMHTIRKKSEIPRIKTKGYGGTTIVPVLRSLKFKSNDVIVVMTDGYFADDRKELESIMKKIKAKKILLTTGEEHGCFDHVIKMTF